MSTKVIEVIHRLDRLREGVFSSVVRCAKRGDFWRMKLGLLGDALLLRRWKLLLLWIAFLPWRMKILLLWNRRCCTVAACRDPLVCHSSSAVEVTSAMDRFSSLADEDTSAMGRGMPRPYIFSAPLVCPSFFGGRSYFCYGIEGVVRSRHAATH